MGTGSGPVYERDNPITRALKQVDQLNQQFGTRATGGGLPPPDAAASPQRVVEGGSATVLPPAPRRLDPIEEAGDVQVSPEEQAELDRLWQEDVARRTGQAAAPQPAEPAAPSGRLSAREFVSSRVAKPTSFENFLYIDMMNSVVVADNGEKFPITPEELTQIRTFAFQVATRSMNQAMVALAKRLGLVKEPTPEQLAAAKAAAEKAAADAAQKEEAKSDVKTPEGESNAGSIPTQDVPPVSEGPSIISVPQTPGA